MLVVVGLFLGPIFFRIFLVLLISVRSFVVCVASDTYCEDFSIWSVVFLGFSSGSVFSACLG